MKRKPAYAQASNTCMIKGGPWTVVKKDVRWIGLFVSWFQTDVSEERSVLSNEDSVSLEF